MQEQFLSWLAGFIDGDGSIYIGVRIQNQNGHDYVAIRPVLNITQHVQYEWICNYIKDNLNIGSVYIANRGKGAIAKATWQTTKIDDMIQVLELIKPYLILKKHQAEEALPVLREWVEDFKINKSSTNTKGGQKVRKQSTVLNLIKVATSLNATMRTSANARGYKTYEDWKPIIKKLYPRQ